MTFDFSTVTELPDSSATREQLMRLYHRYETAARYAQGKRVLEVACGPGLGLGYLARIAHSVVGGDYTESVLRVAATHYRGKPPVVRLDAQHLPFVPHQFDMVLLFEAIYFLAQAEAFIQECQRLLSTSGILLLATVNKDWTEFAPSPYSTYYFSVPELYKLLTQNGFSEAEIYGAFPTASISWKAKLISWIRRGVVALGLMPKTMKGRARLKGLVYGRLVTLPHEVTPGMASYMPAERLDVQYATSQYKILYVVAHRA
jgi:ubiquinone/menaquinone biosynthesis C-methylase UbiE